MDAMIVVDMQAGLLNGAPKHDLSGVIARINRLAAATRKQGGRVVFIQHCGPDGEAFAPGAPGWDFLPELDRRDSDIVVPKSLNDAFAGTALKAVLDGIGARRLLIAGWATDFCVDATLRGATAQDYDVVAVADGHTCSDRPHLAAAKVIRHHNWVWSGLIARRSVRVMSTAELLPA